MWNGRRGRPAGPWPDNRGRLKGCQEKIFLTMPQLSSTLRSVNQDPQGLLYERPTRATREELAWVAGLFEGEGTVSIIYVRTKGARYTRIMVSVANTDPDVLELFQRLWPVKTLRKIKARPRCKPVWLWRLEARQAVPFLLDIRPFIKTRRVMEKVDLALEYQSTKRGPGRAGSTAYRALHASYLSQMRALNHRGAA